MTDTITVTTPQRNSYTYEVYHISATTWNDVGGNYMFAYQTQSGDWQVLYVGQTNSFSARFTNHEKLPEAMRKGATHILAHVNKVETARKSEEAELIEWLKPACNDLLK